MTIKKTTKSSSSSSSTAKGSGSSISNSLQEFGKQLVPYLLILSPDEIRKKRALDIMISSAKELGSTELVTLNCDQTIAKKLAEECSTLSLFSPRKIIACTGLDALNAEQQKDVRDLLPKISGKTSVVFTASSLPANSISRKFFDKEARLIELQDLKGFELRRWVLKEFQNYKITNVPEEVVEQLIMRAEEKVDRLATLVEHISLYSDSESVTKEDVKILFGSSSLASEFTFIDVLLSGNIKSSIRNLYTLLHNDKNAIALVSLISRSVVQIGTIAEMQSSGFSAQAIRESLGLTPWVFNKISPYAKKMGRERYSQLINALLKADSKLKNRSLGPKMVMNELTDTFLY